MNLLDVMKRLYDSEINCGFQSEWDGGVHVWLGGGYNKCDAEQWFAINEFEQMATWLDQEVRSTTRTPTMQKRPLHG
jgi:hypothetical protein